METDEDAIRQSTDFSNRQMRGNKIIMILAIDKTSKLDTGFVGLFFGGVSGLTWY